MLPQRLARNGPDGCPQSVRHRQNERRSASASVNRSEQQSKKTTQPSKPLRAPATTFSSILEMPDNILHIPLAQDALPARWGCIERGVRRMGWLHRIGPNRNDDPSREGKTARLDSSPAEAAQSDPSCSVWKVIQNGKAEAEPRADCHWRRLAASVCLSIRNSYLTKISHATLAGFPIVSWIQD